MRAGTVYIVGAGPGDPSLITVRGRRALTAADVVVYDHIVHPRLLRLAPAQAERIDVGTAAPERLAQEAINLLLVEKAREGKVVVRLKGGDPFVFDSGGREALFLREQGIAFEVVSGVPVAIAAPCYAGVPLTYPGAGDTVVFVRGHEETGQKPPKVDWAAIAKLKGTIVCYAAARQLPGIAEALLTHGCEAEQWAVVIYDGTVPRQRTTQGTLGAIVAALKQPDAPKRPGVLVVGRVAGLRDYLRWFDERPLFGKRVLVTRPLEQAAELIELLEDLGAEAIEASSIRVGPPADFGPLDHACANAASYDWIVFTTANAVDCFIRRLLEGPYDVRRLHGPRICAIGPTIGDRLARIGIKADLEPVEFRAEATLDAMLAHAPIANARILLPRADGAREPIADELRRAGADVTEVSAYRTQQQQLQADDEYDIYKMLLEHQIDVVVFTSPSMVRGFVSMLGEDQAVDLLRSTVVACVGPVTAEAAQRLGIQPSVTPTKYTLPALVQALVDHYTAPQAEPVV